MGELNRWNVERLFQLWRRKEGRFAIVSEEPGGSCRRLFFTPETLRGVSRPWLASPEAIEEVQEERWRLRQEGKAPSQPQGEGNGQREGEDGWLMQKAAGKWTNQRRREVN